MPAPKVKLILKKKYAADTYGYIKIKVYLPGQEPLEKSLRHKIPQSAWDKKAQQVKPGSARRDFDPTLINGEILKEKVGMINAFNLRSLSDKSVTRTYAATALKGGKASERVIEFMDALLLEMRRERITKGGGKPKYSPGYTKMLQTVRNRTETAAGPALVFSDITAEWMRAFEESLAKELNSETTLPAFLKRFNFFLKEASRRGLYDLSLSASYRKPGYKNPHRERLTLEETDKVWALLQRKTCKEAWRTVIAFFLVECYAGIRFSDWSNFSVEKLVEHDALMVRAMKKTGKSIYLPLKNSPRLAKVLDYIKANDLHFTLTEQYTNRLLKEIGDKLDLGKVLTTHVARHTAGTLFLELGYSMEGVAAILGVSRKTVEIYAQMTAKKIESEYERYGGL